MNGVENREAEAHKSPLLLPSAHNSLNCLSGGTADSAIGVVLKLAERVHGVFGVRSYLSQGGRCRLTHGRRLVFQGIHQSGDG